MTICLFSHRYWTDEDSVRFLESPKAIGLDPTTFNGQIVYIANGCRDGELLAEVVQTLQRFGAAKIQLGTLRPQASHVAFLDGRGKKERSPQR